MSRVIDLSHTYDNEFPGFRSETAKSFENDGWNAATWHIYSHAGTHIDAPVHVQVNESGVDKYPVERFICRAHVIDLTGIKPGEQITPGMLGPAVHEIDQGDGVIFHTGWSHYVHDPEMYRNKLPRLSRSLALWLSKRKVNLIGVEPPSVADVNNRDELLDIHSILLGAGIIIVEGLTNLESLKKHIIRLIVLPLKVRNGDGSPARVIALED